jgi:hypothetical protein
MTRTKREIRGPLKKYLELQQYRLAETADDLERRAMRDIETGRRLPEPIVCDLAVMTGALAAALKDGPLAQMKPNAPDAQVRAKNRAEQALREIEQAARTFLRTKNGGRVPGAGLVAGRGEILTEMKMWIAKRVAEVRRSFVAADATSRKQVSAAAKHIVDLILDDPVIALRLMRPAPKTPSGRKPALLDIKATVATRAEATRSTEKALRRMLSRGESNDDVAEASIRAALRALRMNATHVFSHEKKKSP